MSEKTIARFSIFYKENQWIKNMFFFNIVTMTTKILQKIGGKPKMCFQHNIFMLKNWPFNETRNIIWFCSLSRRYASSLFLYVRPMIGKNKTSIFRRQYRLDFVPTTLYIVQKNIIFMPHIYVIYFYNFYKFVTFEDQTIFLIKKKTSF